MIVNYDCDTFTVQATGNTDKRGRLGRVELLIEVAVKKYIKFALSKAADLS